MVLAAEPSAAPLGRPARRSRWWWISRGLLALLLLLLAYYGGTFVQVYRASTSDGARPADAIIVLGAAQYGGQPSPVLEERLDHALALYEEGIAPLIVLTGGNQEGDDFTEANTGYRYLLAQGVPTDALELEDQGTSTWDSLKAVHAVVLPARTDRVVLVTDDYHAYRVEQIAQANGLDATVSPSDSRLSRSAELRQLVRETVAVSIGRIIGHDRLFRIDHAVND